MAKKVWCYTLSVIGVSGLLDAGGCGDVVSDPLRYHIYECMDDNADLGMVGTSKLFTSASGIMDAEELSRMVRKYNALQPVQDTFVVTCGVSGDAIGYDEQSGYGSIDHTDFDGVNVIEISDVLGEVWVRFDNAPLHMSSLKITVGGNTYDMSREDSKTFSLINSTFSALFVDAAVLTFVLDDSVSSAPPADDPVAYPVDDTCAGWDEFCIELMTLTNKELKEKYGLKVKEIKTLRDRCNQI